MMTSVSMHFLNPPEEMSIQDMMNQIVQNGSILDELLGTLGPIPRHYMLLFFTDKNKVIDHVYGPHYDPTKGVLMGLKTFDIDDGDKIVIDGKIYPGSRGLYELI